uniref:Zinc finger DBF-type containing 2 n=1 Tax=Rousettus aegyptiacus TaxID=9407 RepID=A0A7J8JPF4_ROUAE|nr:zinc finger DBF-type containing 2 [Rousettus aegyptiacus]
MYCDTTRIIIRRADQGKMRDFLGILHHLLKWFLLMILFLKKWPMMLLESEEREPPKVLNLLKSYILDLVNLKNICRVFQLDRQLFKNWRRGSSSPWSLFIKLGVA